MSDQEEEISSFRPLPEENQVITDSSFIPSVLSMIQPWLDSWHGPLFFFNLFFVLTNCGCSLIWRPILIELNSGSGFDSPPVAFPPVQPFFWINSHSHLGWVVRGRNSLIIIGTEVMDFGASLFSTPWGTRPFVTYFRPSTLPTKTTNPPLHTRTAIACFSFMGCRVVSTLPPIPRC